MGSLVHGATGCQEPAPAWALYERHFTSGPIHLLQYGVFRRLQGNLCTGACRTSPSFFFTDLGVCRVVPLTCSCSFLGFQLLCQPSFPILSALSQRCYCGCCWIWPWPVAGPSWSSLALALLDVGDASGIFSQMPLL